MKRWQKGIGYLTVLVLLLNLVFFALGMINMTVFWLTISGGAILAYWLLPKIRLW